MYFFLSALILSNFSSASSGFSLPPNAWKALGLNSGPLALQRTYNY